MYGLELTFAKEKEVLPSRQSLKSAVVMQEGPSRLLDRAGDGSSYFLALPTGVSALRSTSTHHALAGEAVFLK